MARRLFFVPTIHSGHAELHGDEARHLTRVLRVEPGQQYEISDNHRLFEATVTDATKSAVRFRVDRQLPVPPPGPALALYAALIKFDHFEWMIEKATELGVHRIVPVASERSVDGLEQAAAKRLERWQKIILESCQQSRRHRLPVIENVLPFAGLATEPPGILLDENRLAEPLGRIPLEPGSLSLLIGPEGGWTDRERALARDWGWRAASLGQGILRAETAAIAALAIVGSRLA
ncbi:MAG: 16S rRNA (uracil(1498)-N(3))-methyltransferase [Acidobacteria bacterium]|nr:16S rRNA (uracil(1498)-N(3))-methyltransferase [Acidobacteriota bacterium]